LKGFIMKNSAKKSPAKKAPAKAAHKVAPIVKLELSTTQKTIVALLKKAGVIASTMKTTLLEAAKLARADLPTDSALSVKEKVAAVTKMYAVPLAGLDDNAKSIFRSALTLYCVPDMKVELLPAKGTTPAVIVSASEALDKNIGKHALIAAASAARESVGQANTKPAKPAKPKADVLSVGLLSQLPAIVNDKKAFDELKAAMLKLGYVVTPKAAVKNTAKAVVETKPVFADMVKQITEATPYDNKVVSPATH
jgi:hypothetical protein